MTSSDITSAVLHKLVEDAAPLIAHAAFNGGSLFYKVWVDTARGLGIEILDPTKIMKDAVNEEQPDTD